MKFQIWLLLTFFYQIFKKMKMPENCHKGPFLMGTINSESNINDWLPYFVSNHTLNYTIYIPKLCQCVSL